MKMKKQMGNWVNRESKERERKRSSDIKGVEREEQKDGGGRPMHIETSETLSPVYHEEIDAGREGVTVASTTYAYA